MIHKFKVTKKILHSLDGVKLSDKQIATRCAVAVAMKKVFPDVKVRRYRIVIPGVGFFRNNKKLTEYINNFDRVHIDYRSNLPEFEFEIKIPEKSEKYEIICRADEISTANWYAYEAMNVDNFKEINGVIYMVNKK